jgi:hypothetical protein
MCDGMAGSAQVRGQEDVPKGPVAWGPDLRLLAAQGVGRCDESDHGARLDLLDRLPGHAVGPFGRHAREDVWAVGARGFPTCVWVWWVHGVDVGRWGAGDIGVGSGHGGADRL